VDFIAVATIGQCVANGLVFDVMVDRDGIFGVTSDGETYTAPTKQALVQKVESATKVKPKRVAVRAVRIDYNDTVQRLTLVGRHTGNGNLLYRVDGEKGIFQLSTYEAMSLLRDLSETELSEHESLTAAVKAAQKALKAWTEARQLDASYVVEQALSADAVDPQASSTGKPTTRVKD
jgi:hypothetical protein